MKTKMMNYARTLDEAIPDATTEVVLNKCFNIGKDISGAAVCACASMIMTGIAIQDTAELTVIVAKTTVKKTYSAAKNVFDSCADRDLVVCR